MSLGAHYNVSETLTIGGNYKHIENFQKNIQKIFKSREGLATAYLTLDMPIGKISRDFELCEGLTIAPEDIQWTLYWHSWTTLAESRLRSITA
jgi:hypothetical protein